MFTFVLFLRISAPFKSYKNIINSNIFRTFKSISLTDFCGQWVTAYLLGLFFLQCPQGRPFVNTFLGSGGWFLTFTFHLLAGTLQAFPQWSALISFGIYQRRPGKTTCCLEILLHVCAHVCVHAHWIPEAGVTGSCEPPDMDAEAGPLQEREEQGLLTSGQFL